MDSTHSSLERLLQFALAGMMILATMLFGTGYRAPWLIFCVALLAAAAIFFVDVKGWFRLPRRLANLLAVAAVAARVAEPISLVGEQQMVAVTYVVLALQMTLWFQVKDQRIYWQLVVLSIAQVGVASALTPGISFVVFLVAYMALGVVALALLTMYRELVRFDRADWAAAAVLPVAPVSAFARFHRAPSDIPVLQFAGGRSQLPEDSYRRTLMGQAIGLTIGSVAIAGLVFVLFPRSNRELDTTYDGRLEAESRSVGFSEDVTLGEESDVATQNPDTVMRVQLFEEPGGLPIQLADEPLFRGAIATRYSSGKWRQRRSSTTRPLETVPTDRYVRQHITLEKRDSSKLFSLVPAFAVREEDRLRMENSGGAILGPRSRRFEFDLATTGTVERRQAKIVPCYHAVRDSGGMLLQMPPAETGAPDPLAGLRAAADRIRERERLNKDDRVALARALEGYLRDSGEFQYSLDGQKRNPALDPIEDFLVEHRTGHCEYFAGALTLMLRSQGIPARIAVGFRAGEWNSEGSYYQVRQLHAHTWVEALLEPKHCEIEDAGDSARWAAGGWLVLDPTPTGGGGAAIDNRNPGIWRRAGMQLDNLKVLWRRYIADLDAGSQQKSIYEPIRRALGTLFDGVLSIDSWRGWVTSAAMAAAAVGRWYRGHWFSLPGACAALLVLVVAAGIYRGAGPLAGWLRRRPVGLLMQQKFVRQSRSELYCRLERALARRGLVRSAGQTPFEFALFASGELSTTAEHTFLAALPLRVVKAFYLVRFGARPLGKSDASAAEQALRTLEETL